MKQPNEVKFLLAVHGEKCKTSRTGNPGHCTCTPTLKMVDQEQFIAQVEADRQRMRNDSKTQRA